MHAYPWTRSTFEKIYQDAFADRLSHALLISGVMGIGVDEFSLATAWFRLCHNPSPEGACGKCKACQLLQANTHPDLVVLEPEGAAQMIKVDQVRSLVGFVAQTPQIGQWKVVVLKSAHRMNPAAANALLKILEEPSGNSLLILASERPQMLLPTVRSRCSHFRLPSPTPIQTQAFLETQGLDSSAAKKLVDQLGNRPIKIANWLEHETLPAWQQTIELLQQIDTGRGSIIATAQTLKDTDLSQLLDWFMEFISGRVRELCLKDAETTIAYQHLYTQMLESKREVEAGSNPNPQLLLETLLGNWRAQLH